MTLIQKLAAVVGQQNVFSAPDERYAYSYDATFRRHRPDVVVRPANTEEVAGILRLAWETETPVVPRGAGTGLSGGSVPVRGGIALDLTRMNRILEINTDDLLAVVEPGVVTDDFARAVAEKGFFFPPDPSSSKSSTIGGNLAENAGGSRAFKYGVIRDYTLGLEVVLADGRVIHTGGRTIKNVSGYDLTRLFVGSEGTLGVITQAVLRFIPPPEATRTLLTFFPRLDDAARTVSAIIARGITPAALEFMDDQSIRVVEEYLHLGLPLDVEALLLVEVDGPAAVLAQQIAEIAALCREMGSRELRVASTAKEAENLWKARKSISPAVARIKPTKISEDATVPRSRIPEMVRRLKEIAARYDLKMVIFGHAGDGNLHPNIMCDERDADEMRRVEQAVAEIFQAALELGGTLSGEHGIGFMKAPFMPREHGENGLWAMRSIKQALDPRGILNPGKIFPAAQDTKVILP
ncbi:FAD-binding protein [Desulfofundulus thermobenzoicus]|uniref:FAD-binding protein n=1 Tax=Desulfofundulus thermobenzoicus TaxID=29376 RepID=A0A6N7IQ09_9FIRM|nr:FAD-linked oxidase C-terminal domain-containing protein [Desulfofundulus thermobenzoicus]MQL51298.1 FAD-binding protein [Desulfofundulus thermobenzoicus]